MEVVDVRLFEKTHIFYTLAQTMRSLGKAEMMDSFLSISLYFLFNWKR